MGKRRVFEGVADCRRFGHFVCLLPGSGGSWTDADDWLHEFQDKRVRVTVEVLDERTPPAGDGGDTKPREHGCRCHWEEGDSACPLHGGEGGGDGH